MKIIHRMLEYKYAGRHNPIVHLFTGNSYITKDARLVMGRGAAHACLCLYPGIDREFAEVIPHDDYYGLRILPNNIGVFQVKFHFRNNASLNLIRQSARQLAAIATAYSRTTYRCNFPGVGNGRLEFSEVLEVLEEERLPANVEFYYVEGAA